MSTAAEMEVPKTTRETWLEQLNGQPPKLPFAPDSDKWYDQQYNAPIAKEFWSAPYDARFPQQRQQRKCFHYYVDYQRCIELKGADYKPCQFFKNVYKDICPIYWYEKWDEWVAEGRFPAKFDR